MAPFLIPDHELEFRATRSGGPGGQHVNTSSTRVEVQWNLRTSSALTPDQRTHLLAKLASKINAEGWIRVVASDSRSQLRNKEAARERLQYLVAHGLIVPKRRKETRIPKAEKARRLEQKRRRSGIKRDRRRPSSD
jgi:ribosome-associated protein